MTLSAFCSLFSSFATPNAPPSPEIPAKNKKRRRSRSGWLAKFRIFFLLLFRFFLFGCKTLVCVMFIPSCLIFVLFFGFLFSFFLREMRRACVSTI
ncbi:Uncharacterized protein APZ42_018861 [Daphnia magna]|uniref:Uncharacterized protein n=1 Tax=Daphnia magna TaxID=35525 RepID=A0A164YV96_9CRUS|nr:Uncharacterized protein APZ42_018861 [Daphnia magna]